MPAPQWRVVLPTSFLSHSVTHKSQVVLHKDTLRCETQRENNVTDKFPSMETKNNSAPLTFHRHKAADFLLECGTQTEQT